MGTHTISRSTASRSGEAVWNTAFLVVCAVVLAGLVTKLQQEFLPSALSTQVGHNSEVWALVLALGTGMFMLERTEATGTSRIPVLLVCLACLGLAAAVYWLGTPPTVKTLNEPLLGAGLLIGYLCLPRPLPRAVPWLITGIVAGVIVVWSQVTFVFLQAESMTALLVAPLAFDVMTSPARRTPKASAGRVTAWLSLLILLPALALASGDLRTEGGFAPDLVDYLARGAEGFWGVALLQLYVVLRRARSSAPIHSPTQVSKGAE
ncbi:hypothetical protein BJ980_003195 [Nocardioides daedukensis]|uniref:Uncharacterized protein n=1 Tax=Nocardioides daedukensis TaxID=634462 RepID=A0A7Y9S496_9ACTN|nr:hypothetical protein [Nocardioides daedukensis]NYG60272.1 hypothetical protein [Nocardioides daedukensis]